MARRYDIWLPTYFATAFSRARARARRKQQTTHIMFLVCDHYEPRHGAKREGQPQERVQTWHREYAKLQARCRTSFGTTPLHTFFYPPHHGYEHLSSLTQMAFDGLGELELHYHHDGDTSETLRKNLGADIDEFARWGVLLESGGAPKKSFAFIHGDWALGNSGHHGKYCGVNDELDILRELGCWADFTMPSGNVCQTRKINAIYYGRANAGKPKAHDWGADARVGHQPPADTLFMMQGPLAINWKAPDHPRPENASLTTRNWGRPDRIPVWLDCNIHVQGKPDWLFVKLHTHGAVEHDFDGLFGEKAFEMHRVLNTQYNDGKRFKLHYVTARQAYNIAKAAEDGKSGDPSEWLDYRIAKPTTHYYALNARHRVAHCTASHLTLDSIEGDQPVRLRLRSNALSEIRGVLRSVDIDGNAGTLRIDAQAGTGDVTLLFNGAVQSLDFGSSQVLERLPTADGLQVRISAAPGMAIRWAPSRQASNAAKLAAQQT